MLKYLNFIFFILFFAAEGQTLQLVENFDPIDLTGKWEYNIPGTNDFIGFHFISQYDVVTGEFSKYTKDSNGNLITVLFDSEADTIPGALSNEAMGGIDRSEYILEHNTFVTMFVDHGLTNYNSRILLGQIATLRLFRSCDNCPLQLQFDLLPRQPGLNPYDQEYTINIPVTMVMTKV